jgi:Transcriptional regulators
MDSTGFINEERQMKPTINDVAKRAGVSKSTVSQFLNKRYSYMSNTTKRRIEKTIKDLKYHPNQIAKSLKQKDTNVIAFICSTLSARFPLELIAVIENYFQKAKYSVIIAKSDDSPDKEKELIESFLARQVDGIIVFPTNENAEYYKDLQEQRVPVVFVDRNVKGVKVPSALLDNLEAGYEATKLLVEKGHRDIAIFSFPMTNGIEGHPDRVSGYKKELTQNNIEINDDNIIISDLKM